MRERIAQHSFPPEIGATEEVLEAFDASRARLNIVLAQILRVPGPNGLDIGTGLGFLPVLAKLRGQDIYATEMEPSIAGFAAANGVHIVEHTIGGAPFPFEPESLDFVVFSEVLEHVRLAPVPVLQAIADLLRSGGKLILTTPNIARLSNLQALIAGENFLEPFPNEAGMSDPIDHIEHIREYSVREVVEAVEAVGLGIESVLMSAFGQLGYEPLPNPFANEIIIATAHK